MTGNDRLLIITARALLLLVAPLASCLPRLIMLPERMGSSLPLSKSDPALLPAPILGRPGLPMCLFLWDYGSLPAEEVRKQKLALSSNPDSFRGITPMRLPEHSTIVVGTFPRSKLIVLMILPALRPTTSRRDDFSLITSSLGRVFLLGSGRAAPLFRVR